MLTATTGKRFLPAENNIAAIAAPPRKKRKLRSYYIEPTEPLPQGIPFQPSDYPELTIDPLSDHSKLVHAFQEPLFAKDPTAALSIAYSHRAAAVEERKRIRKKKKATLRELEDLRNEFLAKKEELLDMNSKLRNSSKKVGGWTRKVFDLELKEPCMWNDKLHKLQEYVNQHGKIPEHIKKTKGTDDEKAVATFISGMRNKVKKGHKSVSKHPHRMAALEQLGVHWESENDARFEIMFAKLLEYKKEHGTFRMPSLDLCKESGDEELIMLHNWVFSQVGSFRYQLKSKKVEAVQRFLDIGFSFEKWYGTNGHVFERSIPKFDDFCRRYVENGGKMDERDVEALKVAAETKPMKKKRKYRKTKKKDDTENENGEEEGGDAAKEGAAADVASGEGLTVNETEGVENVATTMAQQENAVPMEGVEGAATVVHEAAAAMDVAGEEVTTTTTNAADVMVDEATVDANAVHAPQETLAPIIEQAAPQETVATKMEETAIDAAMMVGEATAANAVAAAIAPVDVPHETLALAVEQIVPQETEATKMEETAIDAAVEAVAAQENNDVDVPPAAPVDTPLETLAHTVEHAAPQETVVTKMEETAINAAVEDVAVQENDSEMSEFTAQV